VSLDDAGGVRGAGGQLARGDAAHPTFRDLAKVYGFTDVDGSLPDAWRYLREVQEAGKPADDTGYR
jgi:hypothetical protein